VEVREEFLPGLKDLEGFSHIVLIYHFHLSKGYALEVVPFLDREVHGVFATRAPRRPNSIGISVVRLLEVDGAVLHIEDVDVLDETPLLDIKPYVPAFDSIDAEAVGWLSNKAEGASVVRADERFKQQR
jgi:tRNA-Thr(GGU) m(6)t(6)A37 methyltransferase TsaA